MKIESAEEHRMDDLHPNDDGYEVLSNELREQLVNGSVDNGSWHIVSGLSSC